MQLDQARIAIRRRFWRDNLDLALHVLRANAKPLAICAVVAILPLALMNHALVNLLLRDDFRDELRGSGMFRLMMLIMIEAPLATAPMTLWLGQALFVEKPSRSAIVRAFVSCLPQLVLLQVLARIVLILPVVTWIVPYAIWPYLNEVILLERNPWRAPTGQLSTLRRNKLLHRGGDNDFIGQAIGALCLSGMLVAALYLT
ncbi:MAG TPA: hypothetical protein VHV08_11310, partial [Pirellulales bacterium]|nr:hypothetical protein [Pirellulales bacterium]